MYESFYGFSEKPFNLTPDPKFVYLSGKHQEAFAHLEFGLRQRGGFIVITGEVGTGKTTLCRYFLDRLDQNTVSAFILYPALGTTELLRAINRDLGIPYDGATEKELIDTLHVFLLDSHEAGKNIVLVIDEAQNLSRNVLEQVRLISNLETHTEKLIQIVLLGQSELNEMLAQKDLRQLAQRITARYHLTPLSRRESDHYISHRLAVAGGLSRVEFTDGALRGVHRFSSGIPRLINLVCDRSLLAGYVQETTRIGPRTVRRAAKELSIRTERRWVRRLAWGTAVAALLSAVVLAAVLFARSRGLAWPFRSLTLFSASPGVASAPVSGETTNEAEGFAARLLTLSPETSLDSSAAVLLDAWGIAPGELEGLAREDVAALASRAALEVAELTTSLVQLRALNMPAVLEILHPERDGSLFVALTRLDETRATVAFAPGDEVSVPLPVLLEHWTGRARLFWRDFDGLEVAGASERLAWARGRLERLGLLSAEERESPRGLESAVRELQARLSLEPDGELGRKTQMALYSLAGEYGTPRLRKP